VSKFRSWWWLGFFISSRTQPEKIDCNPPIWHAVTCATSPPPSTPGVVPSGAYASKAPERTVLQVARVPGPQPLIGQGKASRVATKTCWRSQRLICGERGQCQRRRSRSVAYDAHGPVGAGRRAHFAFAWPSVRARCSTDHLRVRFYESRTASGLADLAPGYRR
jgi:hypothetical protein